MTARTGTAQIRDTVGQELLMDSHLPDRIFSLSLGLSRLALESNVLSLSPYAPCVLMPVCRWTLSVLPCLDCVPERTCAGRAQGGGVRVGEALRVEPHGMKLGQNYSWKELMLPLGNELILMRMGCYKAIPDIQTPSPFCLVL